MAESPQAIVLKQLAITAAVVVALVAMAISAIALLAKRAPSTQQAERVPVEAVTKCQDALRARMRYPATVDFGWSAPETRIDGGQYMVWEDFRAQNAFGVEAQMRGMCIFPPNRSLADPEVSVSENGAPPA